MRGRARVLGPSVASLYAPLVCAYARCCLVPAIAAVLSRSLSRALSLFPTLSLHSSSSSSTHEDRRVRSCICVCAAFLVLCNRIVAIAMAVAMTAYRGESFRPIAPLGSYLAVAVSNFVATYSQYEGKHRTTHPHAYARARPCSTPASTPD